MSALPLAPRPLYEAVAERLRERIYARELAPGSWIDETRLAEEYGISRTPLREALKVLASEGLVTMKVRRGAYVTEVNEKDLRDVYHLLALLESDAAAAVATQARMWPRSARSSAFFMLNEQFHLRLLEIADNRWRLQMVDDLRKVMKLNRHHSLFKRGRVEESLQEHAAIVQALLNRDATAASAGMRAHFASGLEAAH